MSRLRSVIWVLFFSLVFVGCAKAQISKPLHPVRASGDNVGIDGYSPVSYFDGSGVGRGNPDFSHSVEGVTYWLRDAQQLAKFRADPQRFLPAHGGWCTLMMGGSGRRTPAHPESYVIVDDQLLMFWSGDTPETQGMGLSNWQSKTKGSAKRERKWMTKADRQWNEFLLGKREAQIFLYKQGDVESVSVEQREHATEAF